MREILQLQFFGNTVRVYLEVFATILVALIIKRIISKYLAVLAFSLFTKAGRTFHKQEFLELVVSPLETFIFLFIVVISLDKLHLPDFLNFNIYRITVRELLDAVADTAIIIAFIKLCLRVIKYFAFILEQRNLDECNNNSSVGNGI